MTPAPALPGVFASLGPVLHHYGYLAVAGFIFFEDFGIPLPGETVLIAAAVYAGAGRLSIAAVGAVAVLAAVLGDNVGYGIGRYAGRALVLRWGRFVFLTGERLDRAEAWFARHGGKIVTLARFAEGLRQANGIVADLTGMRWARFVVFNALGAVLWVAVWSTAGYVSGADISAVYHALGQGFRYIAAAVVALVLAYGVTRGLRRRPVAGTATPRSPVPGAAPHDGRHREPGDAGVTGPDIARRGKARVLPSSPSRLPP